MRKPRIFTWWSMPPQVLQVAVGQPPRQVARAVEARARLGAERIGHEALRRQLRPAQVALRQPRAADVDLARHARPAASSRLPVEHVERQVRDRLADQARRPRRRPPRVSGR